MGRAEPIGLTEVRFLPGAHNERKIMFYLWITLSIFALACLGIWAYFIFEVAAQARRDANYTVRVTEDYDNKHRFPHNYVYNHAWHKRVKKLKNLKSKPSRKELNKAKFLDKKKVEVIADTVYAGRKPNRGIAKMPPKK